jgi:tetratricopeptide (TPR) repeat protein
MALADCETALQIGPESEAYWAYYPRGLAYKGMGRMDEAIADFERFISLAVAGWAPHHPSIELARQEIKELSE